MSIRAIIHYLSSNESLVQYYAKQDGCDQIRLRHRIKAGQVTINFFILVALISLGIANLIDTDNLFLIYSAFVLGGLCVTFFTFLLKKIRNIYILSCLTLLLIGLFIYFFKLWKILQLSVKDLQF